MCRRFSSKTLIMLPVDNRFEFIDPDLHAEYFSTNINELK